MIKSGNIRLVFLLQELKRQFKKRSIALLPEKHPSYANAHSRFEELNAAFVKVNLDPHPYKTSS